MDIIRTLYYIHGAWGDENIFAVLYCLCVSLLWALHIVIKQQFFYIYKKMRCRYVEADYRQTRSLARPLYDSWASCLEESSLLSDLLFVPLMTPGRRSMTTWHGQWTEYCVSSGTFDFVTYFVPCAQGDAFATMLPIREPPESCSIRQSVDVCDLLHN